MGMAVEKKNKVQGRCSASVWQIKIKLSSILTQGKIRLLGNSEISRLLNSVILIFLRALSNFSTPVNSALFRIC